MLLTSGQVSIAISSGIVVVFTAALFLSGYAIQQRTLRDLRAAIRAEPRPSPKIFLPEQFAEIDRFTQETTELADGTVVPLEPAAPARPHELFAQVGQEVVARAEDVAVRDDDKVEMSKQHQPPEVVEQGPTMGEKQKVEKESRRDAAGEMRRQTQEVVLEVATLPPLVVKVEEPKAKSPKKPKAVSRAERRRKIKEDIQKMSQAKTPMLYQRRLW